MSSDLIDRAAVLEDLEKRMADDYVDAARFAEYVRTLPSVEPERKTGEWIPVESQTVNGRCSVCGYESHLYENDVYGENYCPNCGSWLRLL